MIFFSNRPVLPCWLGALHRSSNGHLQSTVAMCPLKRSRFGAKQINTILCRNVSCIFLV